MSSIPFNLLNQTSSSFGNSTNQNVAGSSAGLSNQSVLGTSSVANGSNANTIATPAGGWGVSTVPGNPNPTTGGSGAGTTAAPPQAQGPDPFQQLIDSAFNSRIGDLNGQAGTLQSQQSSILGDINSQADTSKNSLNTNLDLSQSQIDQSAQQGGQRQQDALTAARRLYNELVMGGQQRFGGASSAGEAYQALTGRELQRNNQQIASDYNTFMGQITQAHQTVKAKYDDAVAQLENQRSVALNQAQRDFQDKMQQINSLKSQAAGDKASQQLSALQELRNQVYNINLATAQNNQNIQQFKTQAESQLQSAMSAFQGQQQGASDNLGSFSTNATTNPQTALSFNNTAQSSPTLQTGQVTPTQQNTKNWYDQTAFA